MVFSQRDTRVSMMRPKPPSWQDFVPSTSTTNSSKLYPSPHVPGTPRRSPAESLLGFRHLSHTQRSSSEGTDLSRLGLTLTGSYLSENRAATLPHASSRKPKKPKNRLHRTRSQQGIDKSDLPQPDQLTIRLADTKPRDLGVGTKRELDTRVYFNDNNRRCEQWLAGVHASQSSSFSTLSAPPPVVNLDIPEEQSSDLESVVGAPSKPGISGEREPLAVSSEEHIDSVSVSGMCLDKGCSKEQKAPVSGHVGTEKQKPTRNAHGLPQHRATTDDIDNAKDDKRTDNPTPLDGQCYAGQEHTQTQLAIQNSNEINKQQETSEDNSFPNSRQNIIHVEYSQSPLSCSPSQPARNNFTCESTHSREISRRRDTEQGGKSPPSSTPPRSDTHFNTESSLPGYVDTGANPHSVDKKMTSHHRDNSSNSSQILCQTKL